MMHQSGKMQLLLSILLLACHCTISSWSVSAGELIVTQSPDVSVMEGNSVSLRCCCTGSFERLKLEWEKDLTILKSHTFQKKCGCLTLDFPKIKREDSGRYVCKARVDIPLLYQGKGNGTTINVTSRDSMDSKNNKTNEDSDSSNSSNLALVVPLAVLVPVFLIALICLYRLCRKPERAVRVIYEVPHLDSDVDKRSTSSSEGSTEWRQVPVYESVDYFEGVKTDGSK